MTGVVIGVDGGGSRVRALVADLTGRELARAEGPGAVVKEHDAGPAAEAAAAVVREAAGKARVQLPADALWAGLAGAGREAGRAAAERALQRERLAERVTVGTDLEAAFRSAFPEGRGLMLVAGTGSMALGRDERGRTVRVGGWGEHLGDEGGGFWIGREALRRIARAEDGRAAPTALRDLTLGRLGLASPQDLISWTQSASKADVAALVPSVSEAAADGDAVATELLAEAVAALELHVRALLDRAGPWAEPPALALWGGLLGAGGPLHDMVAEAVTLLGCSLRAGPFDPPAGAVRLAIETLEASGGLDSAPGVGGGPRGLSKRQTPPPS